MLLILVYCTLNLILIFLTKRPSYLVGTQFQRISEVSVFADFGQCCSQPICNEKSSFKEQWSRKALSYQKQPCQYSKKRRSKGLKILSENNFLFVVSSGFAREAVLWVRLSLTVRTLLIEIFKEK